ncbi:short chain dehydrogenase/reductase [Diaporthe amygdali]|uniref:short chain dehydrogenase/reductase n=1 Tax=Phomopsis amygdali TaxID=1214568 RepID=UPI0022FDF253|nr:short chain dehydrogenase/reductase [Diaporthe amygdali]KAJ0117070.1 short chain dehydrogenase/reductase [Diaporthe amygdali]
MSAPASASASASASDAAIHVAIADEIEVAADDTPEPEPRTQPDGPADEHQEQHQEHQQPSQQPHETPQPDPDQQGRHDSQGPHAEDSAHNASAHEALNGHGSASGHDNDEPKGHDGTLRYLGANTFTNEKAPRPAHQGMVILYHPPLSALSPLAIRLIRLLLAHGDYVVACLPPHEIEHEDRSAEFRELINECKSNRRDREGWKDRIRGIRCDGRSMGQCSAAIAEAVQVFGRVDILLCCKFESVVGTVEELSTTRATQNLVRDQFETIFFSQVNFIKAALPQLRAQHTGHIVILTSIGGHIGTPGMPTHTAATWALEGFCDSLAYEIAPFNIKVTIVQPNKEIQSLSNKIILAPQLPWYDSEINPAPSIRDMLSNVLNTDPETAVEPSDTEIIHRYPKLPAAATEKLVMETVHALTAIGGHENPPARHIVGFEGASAVKEKLKTVTEELEDFVEASVAVDIFESELKAEATEGRAHETPARPAAEVLEAFDFMST